MPPRDLLADLAPFKAEPIAPRQWELVALAQKFALEPRCPGQTIAPCLLVLGADGGGARKRSSSMSKKHVVPVTRCRRLHGGINASQLFAWRRQALAKGLVRDNRSEPSA